MALTILFPGTRREVLSEALYNKNSHPSIDPLDELILAVSLREDGKPNVSPLNGHDCYCLQKVYKDAWYDFGVAKGGMAKDKELKCIVPASKDDSFGSAEQYRDTLFCQAQGGKRKMVFSVSEVCRPKTTYLSLPTSKSNNPHRGE